MAPVDALLVCAAALGLMLLFLWELFTRPGFLTSWLVWSAATGAMGFVALLRNGASVPESLLPFVLMPALVALAQLRYRLRGRMWSARAAREADHDAWGNPRPGPGASKPDGP